MKNFLCCLVLLLTVCSIQAQQIIRGRIIDGQTAEPLAGASVRIKNSALTGSSSKSGEFQIRVSEATSALIVSFVGYKTQELSVNSNTRFMTIEMQTGMASLNNVTVTGYENNRKLLETAGSVAIITSKEIQRSNNLSILPILNTVPGVKMEEDAPGNYKISLRGSALRDPYGVRNLKLYWNDIPLTSPDNSASHTLDFDPAQIGSMEIIKGPAGSMYGAGNGGVIIFKSIRPEYHENEVSAQATAGSFGLSRLQTMYKSNTDNFNITASYIHQHYDGYRENEWNNKDALNINSQFLVSSSRTVSLLLDHAEGNLGIAGSVDSAWAVSTPRKAVQFCKDNKTGVQKYSYTLVGVSQNYRFNDQLTNTSSVYSSSQILSHPYGQSIYYNGYLKQNFDGIGGRSYFNYTPVIGTVKSRFTLGAEIQYENQLGNTFDIVNDIPGTPAETGPLQSGNIIRSLSSILFAQASFDLPGNFLLSLGSSYNHLSYEVTDLVPQSAAHDNYTGDIKFKSDFTPRIGLVKTFYKTLAAHASVSTGFSPPTVFESINGDGSFNRNLGAEKGVNYELGFRGTLLKNKFNFDASAYQMDLRNAILPVYNQYGTASFLNAGALKEKGLEVSLYYLLATDSGRAIRLLKPWINFTHAYYIFRQYSKESFDYVHHVPVIADYSGNRVTGVSPNSLNAGVDLETKWGVYGNAVLNYIGRTPINDANTYYQHAYALLAAKIGFRTQFNRVGLDLYVGGRNLLNANYSSMININADASGSNFFYNPSPARNFYGGLTVRYLFNK